MGGGALRADRILCARACSEGSALDDCATPKHATAKLARCRGSRGVRVASCGGRGLIQPEALELRSGALPAAGGWGRREKHAACAQAAGAAFVVRFGVGRAWGRGDGVRRSSFSMDVILSFLQ